MILVGFWLTHLVAVVSPGPSFVVVTRVAAGGPRNAGVAVAAGLALGTFVWALAAWFGLAALFAVVPPVYVAAKLAGAVFLIYLAFQLWRHAGGPVEPSGITGALAPTPGTAVRLGFVTQIANPKVALFFGSIFAAILPPEPGPGTMALVFAIVCINEFAWYAIVALVLSRPAMRRRYARARATIDRTAALLLGGLGLRLAGPD